MVVRVGYDAGEGHAELLLGGVGVSLPLEEREPEDGLEHFREGHEHVLVHGLAAVGDLGGEALAVGVRVSGVLRARGRARWERPARAFRDGRKGAILRGAPTRAHDLALRLRARKRLPHLLRRQPAKGER